MQYRHRRVGQRRLVACIVQAAGSGRQWIGRIHLDDIVGLFIHALDAADTGLLEASPIIGGHDE